MKLRDIAVLIVGVLAMLALAAGGWPFISPTQGTEPGDKARCIPPDEVVAVAGQVATAAGAAVRFQMRIEPGTGRQILYVQVWGEPGTSVYIFEAGCLVELQMLMEFDDPPEPEPEPSPARPLPKGTPT